MRLGNSKIIQILQKGALFIGASIVLMAFIRYLRMPLANFYGNGFTQQFTTAFTFFAISLLIHRMTQRSKLKSLSHKIMFTILIVLNCLFLLIAGLFIGEGFERAVLNYNEVCVFIDENAYFRNCGTPIFQCLMGFVFISLVLGSKIIFNYLGASTQPVKSNHVDRHGRHSD